MARRKDIIDGKQAFKINQYGRRHSRGLIYTEKCGWIDLAHAQASGALGLWQRITNEQATPISQTRKRHDRTLLQALHNSGYYLLEYQQTMGNRYIQFPTTKLYQVKKGMTLRQKKSVALAIYLGVSEAFEARQNNLFWRQFTDSGFSSEDLMSNILGFYRAVEPGVDYLAVCKPVNKTIAETIWDTYGTTGSVKNYRPIPYLYPLPSSNNGPMSGVLPEPLNKIKPALPGVLYREL